MATAPKKAASAPAKAAPAKAAPAKAAPKDESRAPGDLTVSAKLSDNDTVVAVQYNFGANLEEMTELFGEDVVYNKAMDSMVIDLQSKLRRHIRQSLPHKNAKGEDQAVTPLPKDLQSLVADWKPAAGGRERKSAAEKVGNLVGKLSAEERAELIAKLKAEG